MVLSSKGDTWTSEPTLGLICFVEVETQTGSPSRKVKVVPFED